MKGLLVAVGLGLLVASCTSLAGNEPEEPLERIELTCKLDVFPEALWVVYIESLGLEYESLEEEASINMVSYFNSFPPVSDFNPRTVYVVSSPNRTIYSIVFSLGGCMTQALMIDAITYELVIGGMMKNLPLIPIPNKEKGA